MKMKLLEKTWIECWLVLVVRAVYCTPNACSVSARGNMTLAFPLAVVFW